VLRPPRRPHNVVERTSRLASHAQRSERRDSLRRGRASESAQRLARNRSYVAFPRVLADDGDF
jgi:hypothetical protein